MDQAARAIVRLRRDGYTYARIAAYLDRKRIRPARAQKWSPMSVRRVWLRESEQNQ